MDCMDFMDFMDFVDRPLRGLGSKTRLIPTLVATDP